MADRPIPMMPPGRSGPHQKNRVLTPIDAQSNYHESVRPNSYGERKYNEAKPLMSAQWVKSLAAMGVQVSSNKVTKFDNAISTAQYRQGSAGVWWDNYVAALAGEPKPTPVYRNPVVYKVPTPAAPPAPVQPTQATMFAQPPTAPTPPARRARKK